MGKTFGRAGRPAIVVAAALAVAGCASFSPDGGFAGVAEEVRARSGVEAAWVRTEGEQGALQARVAELLAKRPLGVEDAVQVAILNNQGLQAAFAELGMAEADLVQAGRLPNPHFSMFRAKLGHDYKIEQALTFNVLSLVTAPLALEVEKRRFERARRAAALEVLRLAAQARKAWIAAVAAEETVRYMQRVRKAADAGAELARRMELAGNWSALARAREQGFLAEAALNAARAEHARSAARERLVRLLGLWGERARFELPERLPDLPAAADERPEVEREAIAQRLDVRAAVLETEAVASNLGLAKATRFVNVLEVGVNREREGRDEPWARGYEIALELPLFDWGSARVAQAETIYRQSLDRAAQAAIDARSEVREAYRHYRLSHDIARHYRDEIVPLRKRIAEENLLRYNGMLIGVFDLLADARAQVRSVTEYVDALRGFWIAEADLGMAMT
ncbi:MAG: TolC family protein, partial [Burkholderiales bacterium]